MAPVIFWFRRDLRLSDHPALCEAVAASDGDGVVGTFVLDHVLLGPAGPARARFLRSCLVALDGSMDQSLCLRNGEPAAELVRLAQEVGASSVFATTDHGPYGQRRDRAVAEQLAANGISLRLVGSNYVVPPGTIRNEKDLPFKVFSAFRRRWETIGPHVVRSEPDVEWVKVKSTAAFDEVVERASTRRSSLFGELPDSPTLPLPEGGERAARACLESFVPDGPREYRARRDLPGVHGTSGLSPYLRFGCIHPRTVLAATSGSDEGSVTFRSEICWREFYADVLFSTPESVSTSLQTSLKGLRWDDGAVAEERFRAWAAGETGIPFVDAASRELLATGSMHNRSRMIAASFLVKHLHLDWRWGAKWFMWRLVDGDLASNTHGWQWTAGTGTDAAPFHRIFSPLAQAERFDPAAEYLHRWIPELREIPPPQVFQPGGGVDLLHPANYPAPIIDLKSEREEALLRFKEARAALSSDT